MPQRQDILLFFSKRPGALPLYDALEERITAAVPAAHILVQKSQIAFTNRRRFAFVSFLPARRAAQRPRDYITLTFGLGFRLDSPRIDAAVQPYPNRWTHHILIANAEQIDDELLGWVVQAADFSAAK